MKTIFIAINCAYKQLNILGTLLTYILAMLYITPAYSAQSLFSLIEQSKINSSTRGTLSSIDRSVGTVHFNSTLINNLQMNQEIIVPVPGGKMAKGVVLKKFTNSLSNRHSTSSVEQYTVISLKDKAGSVEIISENDLITGITLHDVKAEKIYAADINSNGDGLLNVQDNNDYYCFRFPQHDTTISNTLSSSIQLATTPDISTLQNLQSRPGSPNVLYINYWGGTVSNSYWNDRHNSGASINFPSFDIEGNPNIFTTAERYSMWLAWQESSEDFAPFNINVTTSTAIYNATPSENRLQMVVTTRASRDEWFPQSAGGVAVLSGFGSVNNYTNTAWTWNLTNTSMGMTISHEAGHQLGLYHDDGEGDNNNPEYYGGHGDWGPIMGGPFGKKYVQWSKGDYPTGNQFQDDISIITGYLGQVSDDAGNNFTNAQSLALPVNNLKRLAGFLDSDVYKFTINANSTTQINVIPLLGDEDENRAGNLAIDVSLSKITPQGALITEIAAIDSIDFVPLSPLTNKFDFDDSLAPGTYAITITPDSPIKNWFTSFDNYGNAGEYRLSVSAIIEPEPDLIVESPAISDSTLIHGQTYNLSARVKNQGSAISGNTTLRYYWSNDADIATTDNLIAVDAIGSLEPNRSSSQNASATAPLLNGTYWVGACVDTVSNESAVSNNCSTGVQVTVSEPPAPDLIVLSPSVSDNSLTPGQSLNIFVTSKNQGTTLANSTVLNMYLSDDSTISTSDDFLTSSAISALAASAQSSDEITVNAPTTNGNYWIGACINVVANESNTTNNCSTGLLVNVSDTPPTNQEVCEFYVISTGQTKSAVICL